MSRPLVPTYIRDLSPYKPGKPIREVQEELGLQHVVKLASNENPRGGSPRALEAIRACLGELARYPDVGALDLRDAIAAHFKVRRENVVCGSGSESILANILRTFLEHDDELLTSEGTFVGFYVLAQSRGVALRTVPLRADYHFDLDAMAAAIGPKTRLVYLANPNNPTGTIFSKAEFSHFMEQVPSHTLVVMDEAYIEYVDPSADNPDSLLYRFDNVLTLRTFSKSHGLAGLRVGYGFAHGDLITNLMKVKLPFEPSIPGQAAGVAALQDTDFLAHTLALSAEGRQRLTEALEAKGFAPVPSQANFVMFPLASAEEADAFARHCLLSGVIVRPLGAFRLPHCIRVSTGLREEIDRFIEVLQAW
jgi:histidinol-phosphate aminotransferase